MGQALAKAGQVATTAIINRMYGTGDSVQHTVNGTTLADLSSVYTIPASDALAGTAYRLTAMGNGQWGSTAQALSFSAALAETDVGIAPTLASGVLSTSATFDWEAILVIWCVTSGTSGTWLTKISGIVTQNTNSITPATAADNTIPFTGCTHSAVTQNTTEANALSIQAKWGSTTGTPEITCLSTLFEKVN